jgi:hypothetical protein
MVSAFFWFFIGVPGELLNRPFTLVNKAMPTSVAMPNTRRMGINTNISKRITLFSKELLLRYL